MHALWHARPAHELAAALDCPLSAPRSPFLSGCRHGLLAALDVIHAYVPCRTLQWAKAGEGALLAPRNLLLDCLLLYNEEDSPRFSRYTQARRAEGFA